MTSLYPYSDRGRHRALHGRAARHLAVAAARACANPRRLCWTRCRHIADAWSNLLPAVMFLFRNGDVAALIAVTSYAIAPAVRYGMDAIAACAPRTAGGRAACGGCHAVAGADAGGILPAAFPRFCWG